MNQDLLAKRRVAMGRGAGDHRRVNRRDMGMAAMGEVWGRRGLAPMTMGQAPMMRDRDQVTMTAMVADDRDRVMVAMMVMDRMVMDAGQRRRRQGDRHCRGPGGQQGVECAGHGAVPSADAEIRRFAPATVSIPLARVPASPR
jgi:hypothetical protein